jgi:hypothetical protein
VISTHPPNPNLTSPTLPISIAGLEKYIAVSSFEAFIEHVKILEPPPGGGVIKLEKWPHLIELVSILDSDRLISVLKFLFLLMAYRRLCPMESTLPNRYSRVPVLSRRT